jgi:transposase-like protein
MLSWVTEQLMEIEVSHRTGVVKGKHSGDRKTSRSGYRSRRWDTRVGTVFLSVPKVVYSRIYFNIVTNRNSA